jgi:hypothetical protein
MALIRPIHYWGGHGSSVISHQSSVISHQSSVISHQSAVSRVRKERKALRLMDKSDPQYPIGNLPSLFSQPAGLGRWIDEVDGGVRDAFAIHWLPAAGCGDESGSRLPHFMPLLPQSPITNHQSLFTP